MSGDMSYDPTQMIRKQAVKGRRVIVVSANYRLNILGLLVGQDMVNEADGAAVGNWGVWPDTLSEATNGERFA